jgi:hypothetical protein
MGTLQELHNFALNIQLMASGSHYRPMQLIYTLSKNGDNESTISMQQLEHMMQGGQ